MKNEVRELALGNLKYWTGVLRASETRVSILALVDNAIDESEEQLEKIVAAGGIMHVNPAMAPPPSKKSNA